MACRCAKGPPPPHKGAPSGLHLPYPQRLQNSPKAVDGSMGLVASKCPTFWPLEPASSPSPMCLLSPGHHSASFCPYPSLPTRLDLIPFSPAHSRGPSANDLGNAYFVLISPELDTAPTGCCLPSPNCTNQLSGVVTFATDSASHSSVKWALS